MSNAEPLIGGEFYHVYNRGNNGETLFREQRNYRYFLRLYAKYIEPIAETYAYCLLRNHFHFLIRVKGEEAQPAIPKKLNPSRQFNNLFIAYAKAFNKVYARTGALFERPFQRKRVTDARYLTTLVIYIHRNPQKHGLIGDFQDWTDSSYRALVSSQPSRIQRQSVLGWFDGPARFEESHLLDVDEAAIESLIDVDWV